ncbi:hypothetical protein CSPB12327_05820 [Campylobacter sp. RM12327]|uniref:hypothetical protein n=1 Tax=Campylobacter sputorum TaxID=206 RepID=UPI0013747470|nr:MULTISPECIES: hypothetical protein [Campylobacter]MBE7357945.1 hypothetical protein [Campylobacter sp. RM11302]MBF6669653.1 hypothetical protein [Campylobacter sp. RM12327]MBF6674875.1 hypothetical protein [Campylobacter sp. RM13538]MBF6676508.1 hypothetical protein [Campylobacter sp. RM12321]MBF6677604.1 hypothetical protein [Campylobacter sp. RM11259]
MKFPVTFAHLEVKNLKYMKVVSKPKETDGWIGNKKKSISILLVAVNIKYA